MSILKYGDRGQEVESLQSSLHRLGYNIAIDGIFGGETLRFVRSFQILCNLLPDGIVGPQTMSCINKKLSGYLSIAVSTTDISSPFDRQAMKKFITIRDLCLNTPIIYGPGRGFFLKNEQKWVITLGPGGLNLRNWKCQKPLSASFHCTSLVNFTLSVLINRNDNFTHTGNIPPLFDLVNTKGIGVYNKVKYRGFSSRLLRLAGNGTTPSRNKIVGASRVLTHLDSREVLDRIDELSLFNVWSQSDYSSSKKRWNWDHHVGFFVKIDNRLYRFAADGYASKGVYSATPVSWKEFIENKCLYQVFRFDTSGPFDYYSECPIEVEK